MKGLATLWFHAFAALANLNTPEWKTIHCMRQATKENQSIAAMQDISNAMTASWEELGLMEFKSGMGLKAFTSYALTKY